MSQNSLQDYYGARAPEYDKVYLKPERQADLREIERWLPSVFAGSVLLEVACGTGYWTKFIALTATHVTAFDAAQETLDIARTHVPSRAVEFIEANAYQIGWSAYQFDAGFAGFWISHVPQSRFREFLQGFHRSLAPGAKVVLLDNRFVEGSSTPISRRDADGNTYQIRPLADGTSHEILKNFWEKDELTLLADGLMENVQLHEWKYFWALEYTVPAFSL